MTKTKKVEVVTSGAGNITIDDVQARMKQQGAMTFLTGTVQRGQKALYDLVVGIRLFFGEDRPAEDSTGVQKMAKALDQSARTVINNWRAGAIILTHGLTFNEIREKSLSISVLQAHGTKLLKAENWPGVVKLARQATKPKEPKPRAAKEAGEEGTETPVIHDKLGKEKMYAYFAQLASMLLKNWGPFVDECGGVTKAISTTDVILGRATEQIRETAVKRAQAAAKA